jgi:hypothetical protein
MVSGYRNTIMKSSIPEKGVPHDAEANSEYNYLHGGMRASSRSSLESEAGNRASGG